MYIYWPFHTVAGNSVYDLEIRYISITYKILYMITTTKKTKVKKTTNTNIKFPNLFLCCKHVQFIHYSHSHYTVPLLRCRDLFSLASVTEEYLQDIPKLYKHLHCI